MYFEKFHKLHRKAPVLEIFFKQSCRSSVCKLFRKRMQNKCFPVKFVKLLRTPTLKNINKQLLLEVVSKKAVLKNFAVFTGGKQLMIKCSVKKVFQVVDRAVKVTCFYIEQHLLQEKCSWLNELFFPMSSVLSKFQQNYDAKMFQFWLLDLEKFIFTEHIEMC